MLNVSILVYRAEGCAVLRRAELRCAMPRLCTTVRARPQETLARDPTLRSRARGAPEGKPGAPQQLFQRPRE
eukprot:412575-Pyramimonas_sp.AAC.1